MSREFYETRWPVLKCTTSELRFRFLTNLNSNPSELDDYDTEDLERVRSDNWFITRYLLHQKEDIEDAFVMMKESLRFRKLYNVNHLKMSDLPREYMLSHAVMIYNKDKKDHPLVVIRAIEHHKNDAKRVFQQQYFLYWVERAVKRSDWGIVSILFDCTGAGVSNMDLEFIRFIITVFKKHYPWALSSFFVYNMPWILATLWRMIKPLIPEQYLGKMIFVDNNTIKNYVYEDQLPVALGGTCTKTYGPVEEPEDDELGEASAQEASC